MTDRTTTLSTTLLMLGLVALLAGCGGGGGGDGASSSAEGSGDAAASASGEVLQVVATTGQVGDLARSIGGDRVEVSVLMGPGIDPHLYKASAGDVERLRRADLIVYNGLHLEARMGDVLARMQKPTVAVAEAIPDSLLLSPDGYEGAHDPHVWFDLELWQIAAAAVQSALVGLDPDHATGYATRGAQYIAQLTKLHLYARTNFASIPADQRVLITAHDAFNYLGRAYGLQVRGLQGISTATEAGTGDVQDLAAFIAERRIPAIFVETSVSPRAIEAVQAAVRARGFDVVVGGEIYSDALGDPGTPAGTFLGMVRHNIETITDALGGTVGQPAGAATDADASGGGE
jgi:manganese/zinc/iron transport system substrate-binding protein